MTEQASWLKKMTPSVASFFDLFDFDWFGSWGPWLQSALQTLGITLLIIIIIISLVLCILSKALNACLELLTTKQMSSLRLECQKRNKGNDSLKDYKLRPWPVTITGRLSRSTMMYGYHTKDRQTLREHRAVAKSGAKVLNFDHISQLSWESDQ